MKIYVCTCFKGHYPVGTSAVVAARSRVTAAKLLNEELVAIGLAGNVKPEHMEEFPDRAGKEVVRILNDGDY